MLETLVFAMQLVVLLLLRMIAIVATIAKALLVLSIALAIGIGFMQSFADTDLPVVSTIVSFSKMSPDSHTAWSYVQYFSAHWINIAVLLVVFIVTKSYFQLNYIYEKTREHTVFIGALIKYLDIEVRSPVQDQVAEQGVFRTICRNYKERVAGWLVFGRDPVDPRYKCYAMRDGQKITLQQDISAQVRSK